MANPVSLFIPPRHVPGEKMAELVRRTPLQVRADRLVAADIVEDTATQLFDVPANTKIDNIQVHIVAAFDQSMTLTIGDGADPDRFMDDTAVAPGTIGWKSMLQDAQPGSGGHIYTAADTVDALPATGSPTVGSADVYLFYTANVDQTELD